MTPFGLPRIAAMRYICSMTDAKLFGPESTQLEYGSGYAADGKNNIADQIIGAHHKANTGQARVDKPAVAIVRPLWIGPLLVDPPILQAPMAGFTNYAFRQIVRKLGGAGLLATEMVCAKGFVWLDEHEAEHPDRLWGVIDEPRPLAVQMWDNDPATLAKVGARLAQEYKVSVVDINFGCPVRDVAQKAHSGSYLLREPERMGRIIEQVVKACAPTPVTAKIRLGCTRDQMNAIDVAQVVEGAGAAALTVHGRTAADMFRGSAEWDRIAAIKPHLKRIPLVGNGDLDSAERVVNAFQRYDVDGVMIARASLAKPWLFRQAAAALRGQPVPPDPTPAEERKLLLHHYDLICQRFGEAKGTTLMRKYACCYAQGRAGARAFRSRVVKVSTPAEFHAAVEQYFPRTGS
jgi:tRNA-dihydrouridine synthase B